MALTRVRYVGLSDIREMSKRDLAAAGVGMERGLRWDHSNRHTLYVDGISDEFLAILKDEGTFQVDAVDDTGSVTEKDIVKGAPLDDTGNVVHETPRLEPPDDDTETSAKKSVKAKK
jgi:hypothetical protein